MESLKYFREVVGSTDKQKRKDTHTHTHIYIIPKIIKMNENFPITGECAMELENA
jgi:hypothetical protein